MTGLEIIRCNAMLSGLVISAGLYFQALKIYRTKSAKDLSTILMIALVYNEISWLLYGIGIQEWPIMALTMFSLPAEVLIIVGYIKYGIRAPRDEAQKISSC